MTQRLDIGECEECEENRYLIMTIYGNVCQTCEEELDEREEDAE